MKLCHALIAAMISLGGVESESFVLYSTFCRKRKGEM